MNTKCGRECGNPRGCLIAGCLEEWEEEEAFCDRCGQDLEGHAKYRKICDTCKGERVRGMWPRMDQEKYPEA